MQNYSWFRDANCKIYMENLLSANLLYKHISFLVRNWNHYFIWFPPLFDRCIFQVQNWKHCAFYVYFACLWPSDFVLKLTLKLFCLISDNQLLIKICFVHCFWNKTSPRATKKLEMPINSKKKLGKKNHKAWTKWYNINVNQGFLIGISLHPKWDIFLESICYYSRQSILFMVRSPWLD